MWLLDVNVPATVQGFLQAQGIACERSDRKGWTQLKNGDLVGAAFQDGFRCLLTRDQLFGESASRALKIHPQFAIVLLRLPQAKGADYLNSLVEEWNRQPIVPTPGEVVSWPRSNPDRRSVG